MEPKRWTSTPSISSIFYFIWRVENNSFLFLKSKFRLLSSNLSTRSSLASCESPFIISIRSIEMGQKRDCNQPRDSRLESFPFTRTALLRMQRYIASYNGGKSCLETLVRPEAYSLDFLAQRIRGDRSLMIISIHAKWARKNERSRNESRSSLYEWIDRTLLSRVIQSLLRPDHCRIRIYRAARK